MNKRFTSEGSKVTAVDEMQHAEEWTAEPANGQRPRGPKCKGAPGPSLAKCHLNEKYRPGKTQNDYKETHKNIKELQIDTIYLQNQTKQPQTDTKQPQGDTKLP